MSAIRKKKFAFKNDDNYLVYLLYEKPHVFFLLTVPWYVHKTVINESEWFALNC